MEATTCERMPLRAEVLLQNLRRHQGSNDSCWWGQEALAEEMGISKRQVQHWLKYLCDAGMIEIMRTNRTNNYRVIGKKQAKKTSPSDARFSAHPDARFSAPVPLAPLDEAGEGKQQKEGTAAAASAPCSEKTIAALCELGLPDIHRQLAQKDGSLAEAVLSHARYRFAQRRGVSSKAGYLIGCLRDPVSFGFTQQAGKWAPPAGEGKHGPEVLHRRREAAQAAYERWMALSEEDREKVYQRTITAFSFYQYQARDGYNVVSGCVKMMQQMEEEGRL